MEQLRAELQGSAMFRGGRSSAEKVWKNGMSATHVSVKTEDTHTHRSLTTILEIFEKSKLATPVKDRAAAIFQEVGRGGGFCT